MEISQSGLESIIEAQLVKEGVGKGKIMKLSWCDNIKRQPSFALWPVVPSIVLPWEDISVRFISAVLEKFDLHVSLKPDDMT